MTVGTSAAARVCLPLPVKPMPKDAICTPPGLFCYRISRSHVLLGGAITDGGSVIEWISKLLNLSTPGELETCFKEVEKMLTEAYCKSADKAIKDSEPLSFVPFLR